MATRYAWVLNLDADFELAAGPGYAPRRSVLEAMAPHVEHLRKTLLGTEDILAEEAGAPKAREHALVGRAFCPTPRALAIFRKHGIQPEPHPSVDVLGRVNSRAFSASLGATLPDGAFFTDEESAMAALGRAPAIGRAWRIKRAHGMAGRGQCIATPGAPTAHDLAFVRAGVSEGGVQIEPQVEIIRELALHGMLAADGSVHFGSIVTQCADAHGAWLSTARAGDEHATPEVRARLADEGKRIAAALHGAGYFGPFGFDAFTYAADAGSQALQPRSEINARYSMGFAVGFGA